MESARIRLAELFNYDGENREHEPSVPVEEAADRNAEKRAGFQEPAKPQWDFMPILEHGFGYMFTLFTWLGKLG